MGMIDVIGKDGAVFDKPFDAWGEAYSLYCPIQAAGIKARLHLPVVCGVPGGCYLAFYIGFNSDIEAGVSRADKFAHKWDVFMNAKPVSKDPSADFRRPTTHTLTGHTHELELYLEDGKACFDVDGHNMDWVFWKKNKPLPYVKMTIAASDTRNGFYDKVAFKALSVTIPDAKATAPAIPKGWVRHRAHGPKLNTYRMSVPSIDPKSYGNTLTKGE